MSMICPIPGCGKLRGDDFACPSCMGLLEAEEIAAVTEALEATRLQVTREAQVLIETRRADLVPAGASL